MKIAYIVNTYPRASHTFIRREIRALERRGWQVKRFAMRSDRAALVDPDDLAEDAATEHVLEAGGARIAADAVRVALRRPGRMARAARLAWTCGGRGAGGRLRHLIYLAEAAHLVRRCAREGVVHLHAHFGTNSATVAMLTHALGGPRYSFTVHGPEEFDAPLELSLPEKVRRAAFVVAISSYGRSQIWRWADPADWDRVKVVHCGIEPGRFAEPATLPEGGPLLVAIGRLVEQKGLPVLIDALALAAPEMPGLRLTLVGDGPLRPALEQAIAAQGLATQVVLVGWQDEAQVRRHLGAAQALVLPSFAEGLPMVVMEAMAAGRPVIATAIAGVPELVVPGETGWLAPAGEPAALAAAIAALAGTPARQLAEMGRAARARVLERHDVDREAGKLAALIEAALR